MGARITRVRRGDTLRFGALKAQVLSPGSLSGDANEDSVVLLLDAGGKRFLFTGDCTGTNEILVGSICARGPPLYVLKVAHHASRSSTSSSFLSETDPRYAVIEVGRNSYGHPTPQTIAALRAEGTRIYSTQRNGTVTVTVSAGGKASWSFSKSSQPVTRASSSSSHSGRRQREHGRSERRVERRRHRLHHRDGRVLPPRRLPLPLTQQDQDLTEGCQGPRLPRL